MSIATLRPQTQIALAIIVPICCFALGAILVWPPVSGLNTVKQDLESTQQAIVEKQKIIEEAEAAAAGRPLALAVAAREEQEPIDFLRQFSALVAESGATLVSVRATKLPPIRAPGAQPAKKSASPQRGQTGGATPAPVGGQRPVLPATVSELNDQVTVNGTFGSILSLLVRIETFERILSVSRCRVTAGTRGGYPRLSAVFTLSRFVALPESQIPPETTERR
jgi:hypothetical protein